MYSCLCLLPLFVLLLPHTQLLFCSSLTYTLPSLLDRAVLTLESSDVYCQHPSCTQTCFNSPSIHLSTLSCLHFLSECFLFCLTCDFVPPLPQNFKGFIFENKISSTSKKENWKYICFESLGTILLHMNHNNFVIVMMKLKWMYNVAILLLI